MIQGIDCIVWQCQIHVLPVAPARYGSNKTIRIVAPKIDDAIAMLRSLFPTCTIHSVMTTGQQQVFWDTTAIPIITDPSTKGGS